MIFSSKAVVNAPIQRVFNFHLDTNNLKLITPKSIDVDIVELELPLHKGSIITLDITKFFITQRWSMEIEDIRADELIVDRAIESPFKSFRHEHRFKKIDDITTEIEDFIEFDFKFLPLISNIFVKIDLKNMFNFRYRKTREILEG